MTTINNRLRTPAVTFALITQKTESGLRIHTFCLIRIQYKKIKRGHLVIICNIGKQAFYELNKKAV